MGGGDHEINTLNFTNWMRRGFPISPDGGAESSSRAALPMQAAASALPNNEVAGDPGLSNIDMVDDLEFFDTDDIDFDLSAIATEPMETTYSSDFAGGEWCRSFLLEPDRLVERRR